MRLEVFEKTQTNTPEPVRLKLEKYCDDVRVVAVDESGERLEAGSLITFESNGIIHRHTSVADDLGFQRDFIGRIVMD